MRNTLRKSVQTAAAVALGVSLLGVTGCVVLKKAISSVHTIMTPAGPAEECTLDSVNMNPDLARLFGGINGMKNIPEFHDCQRFVMIAGADSTYSPAFAVFATEDLGGVWRRVEQVTGRHFEVAAAIFSWGSTPYTPLGIEPGFNCVYVGRWDPDGPLLPFALVAPYLVPGCALPGVPVFDANGIPTFRDENGNLTARGKLIALRHTTVATFNQADYPVVARWQWDNTHRQYYIGLGCGKGWCELHERNKAPPQPVYTAGADRVASIPGWYDEQILAGRPSGATLGVSDVVGTAVPHPSLGAYTMETFAGHEWIDVAYVSVSANNPVYFASYGFTRAPFDQTDLPEMNQIKLCYGSKRQCGVPRELKCTYPNVPADQMWWVKVHSSRPGFLESLFHWPTWPYVPQDRYMCAERRAHPGANIPGAVRWRWTKYDETIWIRCADGCCEVDS